MKKLWMMLLTSAILLCGCQANSEKEIVSESSGDMSKAQEISVFPANSYTPAHTITDSEEISDFILALDMEHWEMQALPETAELAGTFQLSQEETVKFGESAADGELHSVFEMQCYEDIPYVTLKIPGMKMTFKVSDTAMEYLTEYFRYPERV